MGGAEGIFLVQCRMAGWRKEGPDGGDRLLCLPEWDGLGWDRVEALGAAAELRGLVGVGHPWGVEREKCSA
jgi:hypothetical protein